MYIIHESPIPVRIAAVSFGFRSIPLSRRGHVVGWHPVRPGHAQVPFESRLERDAIAWLAGQPGFASISAQPFTVWLSKDDGAGRYTPDFHVQFDYERNDSSNDRLPVGGFLIEVKYEAEWRAAACTDQRAALSAAAQVVHAPIVVLTERDLRSAGDTRHD